jgi:hypothetical protein
MSYIVAAQREEDLHLTISFNVAIDLFDDMLPSVYNAVFV